MKFKKSFCFILNDDIVDNFTVIDNILTEIYF